MTGLREVRRRRQAVFRRIVVAVLGTFFVVPLLAMLEFTTRGPHGTRSAATWKVLADFGRLRSQYPPLWHGVIASGGLVLLTVALMLVLLLPTAIWVRLRLRRLRRPLEFVCLLPLTIPAVVLVVGLAPVYAWVTYLLNGSSVWLAFAYTILVLPYAYRALDAGLSSIDVTTLAEAARSLGAGWTTVMVRVIIPNIRTAILSAVFLSVALVLGEFTIASLLNRDNLQVGIDLLGKRNASVSVAVSLAALVLAFILIFALSFTGGGRRRRSARAPALSPDRQGTSVETTGSEVTR